MVDCLTTYKSAVSGHSGQLLAPKSLRSLPLYVLSLMKQVRTGICICEWIGVCVCVCEWGDG